MLEDAQYVQDEPLEMQDGGKTGVSLKKACSLDICFYSANWNM